MPVSFDLIVMLKKERFNTGCELHIKVQNIDREGDHKEPGSKKLPGSL